MSSSNVLRVLVACLALSGCDDAFDLVHVDPPDGGANSDTPTIPSGLIAWFPMDAVTTRSDELVAGHHATCSTISCPTHTTGVRAGALAFDGAIQRLDVEGFPELDTLIGYTVSAWVRPDAYPTAENQGCALVKRYTTVDTSWQFCLNGATNRLEMWSYSSMLDAPWPSLGTWAHVVGVWDGTFLALFVDDMMIGTRMLPTVKFDGGPLVIGASDAGGTVAPFAGAVDDVRIFNRALSAAEVHELFSAP